MARKLRVEYEGAIYHVTNLASGGNILTNAGLMHYDIRRTVSTGARHVQAVLGTNAATLIKAVASFKEQWPQIQLDYDPVLLSPKSILPRFGFLTGPGGSGVTVSDATAQGFDLNDPDRPVKAFLQEYQTLFGFGPEEITNAIVQRDYVSSVSGARAVVWQQQVAGIPVFNALFTSQTTATGELASISSEFIPAPTQAADPAVVAAVLAGNEFPVCNAQALLTAVTNVGDLFDFSDISTQTDPQDVVRSQSYTAAKGIKTEAHVELTWFPASRNELKLAWQVIFTSQWRNEMYLTVVSALDNQILYRRNLTADGSEASYRVYGNYSPAPMSPGLSSPGTAQAPLVDRALITLTALDTNASPNGWINDSDNETRGNNVDAHLDHNDDNIADLPRPTGDPWRVFDFSLDLNSDPDSYGNAAVVQLFYWDNWMHDALYGFGFTEAAGNFQNDNFGRGGLAGDAVQADAQDGASLNDGNHRNNANMSTPPDGYAPQMQMYVFDGVTPARDGSLDAEIVLHEYTHGLSTRTIGGGAGIDALQTAGMGEGWSDFYALALLTDPAADVDGTYPMGSYVTYHGFGTTFEQNYYYGIRHYPYCTDTNKNPLTFGDIDPSVARAHAGVPCSPLTGPISAATAGEVHAQGEVWCMMLWEMRAGLIRKYGATTGNSLALQLVTDGLKLSPANPNFAQARDDILLADRMDSGGVNASEIWRAFARRGLGFSAKCPESYTSTGVQESREPAPVLAAEQVEIQTVSGSIELGSDSLLIHLANQGDAAASHVTGRLTTSTVGVSVAQGDSTYADIPQGGSRANDVAFQIQTGTGFVEGTPIDLVFVITSDQNCSTNFLRLYTGVPGAEILFDNYSALAEAQSALSAPKDLTPWDLKNMEPLWMADDASCLLKAGVGKYLLWSPNCRSEKIVNENFLAHRLTHNGTVVGTLTLPVTFDELNNKIANTMGVRWDFDAQAPESLTWNEYHWPKNGAAQSPVGMAYSLANTADGLSQWLTNVTIYPKLQDVWDQNRSGLAVGSVSVLEPFTWQQVWFGADGTMNWFTPSERGLDAGAGANSVTELRYFALLSTAGQFDSLTDWRWLGPLSADTSPAIALLVNDAGMIAGYGGVYTGDPALDVLRPSHAFRAPATGEYDGSGILLTNDLGVLSGGVHSMPRAMNQAGGLAGFSDFAVSLTGGLNASPYNAHAVYWGLTNTTPEGLPNYPASAQASYGYGDAFGINDGDQIVGGAVTANNQPVGVLWQRNRNTNGGAAPPYWEITDLNERLADASWQVVRAVDINNDGLILAQAFDAAGANHAVLLVKAQLAVDANRDGVINMAVAPLLEKAVDETTSKQPFYWWLNDDQDTPDYTTTMAKALGDYEPEHLPAQAPDMNDTKILTTRDLEDFSRIHLYIGEFYDAISSGSIQVGLEWKDVQGSTTPKVKVFAAVESDGGWNYIKDPKVAQNQVEQKGDVIRSRDNQAEVVPGSKFIFPMEFWKGLSKDNPKKFLLFEATGEGKGQLVLAFYDVTGRKLGESVGVWLDLKNIEKMYMRGHSTPVNRNFPLPYTGGEIYETTATGGLRIKNDILGYGLWLDEQDNQLAFEKPWFEENKCIVFVHGIDITIPEVKSYSASFFKRLYWEGYRGRLAVFRWSTTLISDNQLDVKHFDDGEYRSWSCATGLKGYVDYLKQRMPGATISIAGHSLGNACVGEALRQGMEVDNYVMLEAAVSLSCYFPPPEEGQSDELQKSFLPALTTAEIGSHTPNYYTDQGYRGYLMDIRHRIHGNWFSYYNPLDFWLATGHIKKTDYGYVDVNWVENQRSSPLETKPLNLIGFSKYEYNGSLPEGQRCILHTINIVHHNTDRPVEDTHEALSYVARSRTRAVGAEVSGGNPVPPGARGALNLGHEYGFKWARADHSGQFQRDIQLMYSRPDGSRFDTPLYEQLINNLDVKPPYFPE